MTDLKFRLEINCDNDAFQAGAVDSEVARILRSLAEQIEHGTGDDSYWIVDANGNSVGRAVYDSTGWSATVALS